MGLEEIAKAVKKVQSKHDFLQEIAINLGFCCDNYYSAKESMESFNKLHMNEKVWESGKLFLIA